MKSGRSSVIGRVLLERQTVHIHDVRADPDFVLLDIQRAQGWRTALGVPLMREGAPIGVLFLSRKQVKPFTDKQIELVNTFADQAVIAIENTRLLNELRGRTDELARSVEELRALGEVSQAVNSTLDLETVLSTIVAKAVPVVRDRGRRDLRASTRRAREFRLRATYGMTEEMIDALTHRHIGLDEAIVATALAQREPIQIADLREEPRSASCNEIILRAGYRALLVGAAHARRRDRRHARGPPQDARRVRQEHRRSDQDFRGAIGAGDPERAAVPRDRGQEPPARGREPAQIAIPRQHEPRAAHAAQRHPRLYRADPRQHLRRGAGRACAPCSSACRPTASTCSA